MKTIFAFLLALACIPASAQLAISGSSALSGSLAINVFTTAGVLPSGNSFTLVQWSNAGGQNISMPVNITAGNFVVVAWKWEGSGDLAGVTNRPGDVFLFGTKVSNAGSQEPFSQITWLTSAQGGGAVVSASFTNGTPTAMRGYVYEFSATGTRSLDVEATAGTGTSTSLLSGSASSGTTNGLAIGFYAGYTSGSFASPKIGGVAADGTNTFSDCSLWYRLYTTPLVNATATATTPNNRWNGHELFFKAQ